MHRFVRLAAEAPVTSLAVLALAFALLAPLEELAPGRRHEGRRPGRWADALHGLVNPVVISLSAFVTVTFVQFLLRASLPTEARELFVFWVQLVGSWPIAAQVAAALLISGLSGYWVHRALHEWPPLWRLHAVHHSSEPVDWLSAHRQHPVETFLVVLGTAGPVALLGFAPPTVVAVALFSKLHVFYSHANLKGSLGPLRHVLVTPRHHQWHHARDARCNYAGMFPFLDRLFGTHHDPGYFPDQVGTKTWVKTPYLSQLFHPLTRQRATPELYRELGADDGLFERFVVGGLLLVLAGAALVAALVLVTQVLPHVDIVDWSLRHGWVFWLLPFALALATLTRPGAG
jgi:sterol desaturase/sphingolipid hydroxylase (fatty acid hydroxylase superfamily)